MSSGGPGYCDPIPLRSSGPPSGDWIMARLMFSLFIKINRFLQKNLTRKSTAICDKLFIHVFFVHKGVIFFEYNRKCVKIRPVFAIFFYRAKLKLSCFQPEKALGHIVNHNIHFFWIKTISISPFLTDSQIPYLD